MRALNARRPWIGVGLAALPDAIAVTLLAALPAFVNLASERIFEEEKSLLLRAAAVLALPGAIVAWHRHGARFRRQAIVVSVALFVLWLVVAALAGIGHRDAFMGAYLKRHGVVTWLALAVLFAAMCVSAGVQAGRERLVTAIAIGSIWPSVYLLLQRAGVDRVEWIAPTAGFMAGSTFGNHVYVGGYLAVVIPLTAMAAWRSRRLLTLLPLQLAALAASGSRGAVVAMAAGALVFALAVAWARIPRRAIGGSVMALGIAAATLTMVPATRPQAIVRALDPRVGSARVRVLLWKGAVAVMRGSRGRLWIGYGPESLHRLFPPYYSPEIGHLENIDAMPDRAHNELLDTLVGAGVVGTALELFVFAAAIAGALRLTDRRLRAGLAAAAVGHVVEIQFGIATVVARLLFLTIAAIVVGSHAPEGTAVTHAATRSASGKRTRMQTRDPAPIAPSAPSWIWLCVPALVGALSPLLAMLPAHAGSSVATGTATDFVNGLARLSLATPLLYATLFAAALVLARAMAGTARPVSRPWLHGACVVGGMVAVVPLSIDPSRADIVSQAAAGFESQRQWAEAAIAYREASRMQPAESYYLAGLGRALTQGALPLDPSGRETQLRDAREAFERARALAPFDLDHARHLAGLLRTQAWNGDEGARAAPLAEADRIYAEATELAPGLTSLWIEWAYVDIDRHRLPEALHKLARALALDDSRVDARLLRDQVQTMQENRSR